MWARFDDQFDRDEDIEDYGIPASALGLFACSITFCSRRLTDGYVPLDKAQKLPGGDDEFNITKLLDAGWWTKVEDGYYVVSFLKYNPSKAEVEEQRDKKSQAGRMSGESRRRTPVKHSVEHPVQQEAEQNTEQVLNRPESRIPNPESRIPNPVPPSEASSDGEDAPAPVNKRTRAKRSDRPQPTPVYENPPTIAEVEAHFKHLVPDGNEGYWRSQAEGLIGYHESRGWLFKDGQPVISWKGACVTWLRNESRFTSRHNEPDGRQRAGPRRDAKADAIFEKIYGSNSHEPSQ